MCKTFYLVGTTCVGKDYMADLAVERYPNLFGSVNVGKEFRRRYPPEYFQGLGAPSHTEDEAFEIFIDQWEKAKSKGVKYILVSGQPRRVGQVERILERVPGTIIWLWAPNDLLEERLQKRFPDDPAAYDLSLQRLTNDKIQLYEVLHKLILDKIRIYPVNVVTTHVGNVIDRIAHHGAL